MRMSTIWRMAWRAWRRDWRQRESRVIALALVVAVAAMTSVGFFVERVERAMDRQAATVLGGDLAIGSSRPFDEPLLQAAQADGLASARHVEFPSVVLAGDRSMLAQIKAVGEGYPLRGELRIQDSLDDEAVAVRQGPAPGEVWVEARLLAQLEREVGEVVSLGHRELRIGAVLAFEPDRSTNLFQLAPRAMLNLADLDSTGLISPASRVRHTWLLAGADADIARWQARLERELGQHASLRDTRNAQPELQTALDRAARFLGLAALISTLLAGIAIAVAARGLAAREAESIAVERCLGAQRSSLLAIFLLRLLWIAVFSGLVGAVIGFGVQSLIAAMLADWFVGPLPAAGPAPVAQGVLLGAVALLGFALPAVLRAVNVRPLAVLRHDVGYIPPTGWSVAIAGLAAIGLLLWWQAQDPRLAAVVFAGVMGAGLVLVGVALVLVRLLRRLPHGRGMVWRFGLAAVGRRGAVSVTQIAALGLGLMVMLLLAFVRVDLLSAWERTLPADAPNQFLINIQPDELDRLRAFFADRELPPPAFYPMLRGRLVAINGEPVTEDDYANPRAQRLATREFNLSWLATLPGDNRVVAGRWWDAADHGQPLFSVEEGIAETLGLAMGDELTYDIAGEQVTGRIDNLRHVNWDSFNVNFFVVAPPVTLDGFPATYITSFYLAPEQRRLPVALVQEFPGVTVLDVRAIMDQVRGVMERATWAVELVFLFTLAAGVLVLYATIQASRSERERESAVLRTLGAGRRRLALAYGMEFAITGLLAGLLAAVAAQAVGLVLARHIFELPYEASLWVWPVAMIAGIGGVVLAGVGGLRAALRTSPARVLQGG